MSDQLLVTVFVLTTCRNDAIPESKFAVGHQCLNTCVIGVLGHSNYCIKQIKMQNQTTTYGIVMTVNVMSLSCSDIHIQCGFEGSVPGT